MKFYVVHQLMQVADVPSSFHVMSTQTYMRTERWHACCSAVWPALDMPHCFMPLNALPMLHSTHCPTSARCSAGTPELSRRLRTSLCFFWGRANLPLPRKHDILSAVGPTVRGAWHGLTIGVHSPARHQDHGAGLLCCGVLLTLFCPCCLHACNNYLSRAACQQ